MNAKRHESNGAPGARIFNPQRVATTERVCNCTVLHFHSPPLRVANPRSGRFVSIRVHSWFCTASLNPHSSQASACQRVQAWMVLMVPAGRVTVTFVEAGLP